MRGDCRDFPLDLGVVEEGVRFLPPLPESFLERPDLGIGRLPLSFPPAGEGSSESGRGFFPPWPGARKESRLACERERLRELRGPPGLGRGSRGAAEGPRWNF